METLVLVLAIIALVLAVVAVVVGVLAQRSRQSQARRVGTLESRVRALEAVAAAAGDGEDGSSPEARHIAVVLNPSKHDDPVRFRQYVHECIERFEGTQATFYETTVEDPGSGQARQALADGADLVIAAGGDGTVRVVASALAGSGARMAILPVGTGNLLARNLEIPLEDVEGAVRIALLGDDKRIDIGWLRSGDSLRAAQVAEKKAFLVMAGVGADAEVIGATSPTLKHRIGWIAYVLAGLNKVIGRSADVRITLPGGTVKTLKARTVLIGNVGRLPAGIVLMPDAAIDNGRLEILSMGWRSAAGLSQILTQLVAPRMVGREPRFASMERFSVSHLELVTSKPLPVQLDGDTKADATHVLAEVEPGALLMRIPGAR